jgi:flagella basal body P-ring formation protein FlgA
LRQADLRDTPLVRAGDTVDLAVQRGSVVVTVRATARQDGVLGQIVTVRNDINGKLATGRVSGPGLVEWRR